MVAIPPRPVSAIALHTIKFIPCMVKEVTSPAFFAMTEYSGCFHVDRIRVNNYIQQLGDFAN
jgi:hypothetical protein